MIFHKYFTYTIVLFFLLSINLYSQEDTLSINDKYREVERLISLLDYNGAINLLVDIVKSDPEEMEKAQGMIQDIREKKEEFNKKYEELITVLFEENDYNKGLQIIDELEQLDKNPNPATEETIRGARISAELIYFRLLFNEAMDRAYQFLINGQYDQAVRTYLTGFNFHKRTYNERDYGDIIKVPVDSSLEELMDVSSRFLETYTVFQSIDAGNITGETAGTMEILDSTYTLLSDYASYRNTVWHAGWTFRSQNELLGEINSEYSEDFFLSFAWRIVYGRTNQEQEEGLVVAMDTMWQRALLPILGKLEENLAGSYASADQAFQRGDWAAALQSYESGEFWSGQAIRFNLLWSDLLNLDERTSLTENSRDIISAYYSKQVNYSTQYRQSLLFAQLSQFNQRLVNYSQYNNQDFALMNTRRDILDQEIENLVPFNNNWSALARNLDNNAFYNDTLAPRAAVLSLQAINDTSGKYSRLKGAITLDMADLSLAPIEEDFQKILSGQENALSLLEGISAGAGDENLLYVYPQRSLAALDILYDDNEDLQNRTREFLDEYSSQRVSIPQKTELDEYLNRAQDIIAALETALGEYDRISGRADQNIVQAQRYMNEGEYRYSQAENSLDNRDFRQAVQELTTAQNLFVQALSYNEDIMSRDETDRRIAELQERILYEENREVIRYVRENVNQGKSLYLQGRYAQSEIVLLRAESRWFTTNSDPNSEINYWLNLVRAALSVESGRTIEDTEPLYAEMTQFLNLAYANFETGRKLIEEGNVTDGLKYLDQADQNLNEILIPMPLNQAASVLKLKIQQLRDPDLFLVVFSEKFNSAVSRLRTETDEAYIELKDLAAIEPNYRGIQKAIYDAEILLGIRVPPPNPADLRESADLYQKAFAIVEGNVRSQFPVALAQLEKAIELNPENSQAIELKDRIQLDAGGQTTIVLSSAAQSQFKNAEEKYINGEYFEAYAIVQQLLRDQDNASYPPLQDLKRRIESKF